MGEMRVDGAGDDLAVHLLELFDLVGELSDLGGAHEGKIKWVEEEHDVLALELLQGDVLELLVPEGLAGKGGGWLSNHSFAVGEGSWFHRF